MAGRFVDSTIFYDVFIQGFFNDLRSGIIPKPVFCCGQHMGFDINKLAGFLIYFQVAIQEEINTVPGSVVPEQPETGKPGFQAVFKENNFLLIILPWHVPLSVNLAWQNDGRKETDLRPVVSPATAALCQELKKVEFIVS